MQPPRIASREDWLAARKWLLAKEREPHDAAETSEAV